MNRITALNILMLKKTVAVCLSFLALLALAGGNELEGTQTTDVESVTLLFTNDLESAYDPTFAFWRDDLVHIGGIAQIAALINDIRAAEENVFLFDSGDIFTGTLSKLTRGELPFELMITIGYDAMAIGNHEFEYGWQEFAKQKSRAPFPVLGANLFYKDTDHPYAQPYAVVERGGVRIGVIGILGQDAATALIPSNISGVDVREPSAIVAKYVRQLREDVDLIILLTHQGHTAPMQTDDEAHKDIQRDIVADINLAGSVEGIDVLFGGHADAGTEEPVVHPETGTLIMQTYGQGFHLGYLKLALNPTTGEIQSYDGSLLAVDSDSLPEDPAVAQKLQRYRKQFPEIYEVIGHSATRLNRQYNRESDIGNLFADVARQVWEAEIGVMPSGAIRKDLPKGPVKRVDVLDAFPFEDRIALIEVSGAVLLEILEQGLSLDRGMVQVSGLTVTYDSRQSVGKRAVRVLVGDEPLDMNAIYRVGTVEIIAKGGDRYEQATKGEIVSMSDIGFAEVLEEHFRNNELVSLPRQGRLLDLADEVGRRAGVATGGR